MNSKHTKDESPPLPSAEVRRGCQAERDTRFLVDLDGHDFNHVVKLAAKRLPRYANDVLFSAGVRAVWLRNLDELPPGKALRAQYLAQREDWLEESVVVLGEIPEKGVTELARLAIEYADMRRRLALLERARS